MCYSANTFSQTTHPLVLQKWFRIIMPTSHMEQQMRSPLGLLNGRQHKVWFGLHRMFDTHMPSSDVSKMEKWSLVWASSEERHSGNLLGPSTISSESRSTEDDGVTRCTQLLFVFIYMYCLRCHCNRCYCSVIAVAILKTNLNVCCRRCFLCVCYFERKRLRQPKCPSPV